MRDIFLLMGVIGVIALTAILYTTLNNPRGVAYNKKEIEKRITQLIRNNGDLESVKHSYSTELKIKGVSSPSGKSNGNEFIYVKNIPTLNQVLMDIKNDQLVLGDKDTLLLKVDKVIANNRASNPFDKLDSSQKYLFENVLSKIDSNYHLIEGDISRISDELDAKNKLVDEYLADARSSYLNSLIAMTIATLSLSMAVISNAKKITFFFKKKKKGEDSQN